MADSASASASAPSSLAQSHGREFTTDTYFSSQPRPPHLADKTRLMDEFTARWNGKKKVVLVTVGEQHGAAADARAAARPSR